MDEKEITFERAGAGKRFNWSFNLEALYESYIKIQNFENTRAFKAYFPDHYLQARMLLLAAGLLELV